MPRQEQPVYRVTALNEVCVLPYCDHPLAAKTVLTPDDFRENFYQPLPHGQLSTVVGYVICRTSGEAQNGGGNA